MAGGEDAVRALEELCLVDLTELGGEVELRAVRRISCALCQTIASCHDQVVVLDPPEDLQPTFIEIANETRQPVGDLDVGLVLGQRLVAQALHKLLDHLDLECHELQLDSLAHPTKAVAVVRVLQHPQLLRTQIREKHFHLRVDGSPGDVERAHQLQLLARAQTLADVTRDRDDEDAQNYQLKTFHLHAKFPRPTPLANDKRLQL